MTEKDKGYTQVKRCPVCQRDFPESQKFCDQDGALLISTRPDEPAKLLLYLSDGSATTLLLSNKAQIIGKSSDCDLMLSDVTVSRTHALIEPTDSTYVIRDLGSLNGVIVNGRRIVAEGRRLVHGDNITLGRTKLVFMLDSQRAMRMEEAAPRDDQPALHLDDRYEIVEKLSEDTFGTIYRARRKMLRDEVAIRVLRPEMILNQVARERFRRQAVVAARIKHPNSVQVYDFGYSAEGAAYIVEDAHTGRTLRDLMREERGLSLLQVVDFFNQICGAVHAAHLHGIVLRDIKPETIYLEPGPDGREVIKIGGYGLAKVDDTISRGKSLTGPLGVIGTPPYTSPEQWLGQMLDGRADVYTLGIILFELLTGRLPFQPENPSDWMDCHLRLEPADLSTSGRSDLDEGISAVVARALAKEPQDRTPSALLLAEELQAAAGLREGVVSRTFSKLTGMLPVTPIVVAKREVPPPGESVLPPVVPEIVSRGQGAFNKIVLALTAEAFLARLGDGLMRTLVPLYALLVFGLSITRVMWLVLIQNLMPILFRPLFAALGERYGKKKVYLITLGMRTVAAVSYAWATMPFLFVISFLRGISDSSKGISVSGVIANNTDQHEVPRAYAFYNRVRAASVGLGEGLAALILLLLIVWSLRAGAVPVNIAVLERLDQRGANVEQIVRSATTEAAAGELAGVENPLRVDRRDMALHAVPLADLPKLVTPVLLRKSIGVIFILSAILSALSLLLVVFVMGGEGQGGLDKLPPQENRTSPFDEARQKPNVWSFALLGVALTAPGFMVTGEFFVLLAIRLQVEILAFAAIMLVAGAMIPLFFGSFFGWLSDRLGAGRVIMLRSMASLLTSFLFWIVPSFAGTAMLAGLIGLARAIDEAGKTAFKPIWGAISAKVAGFNTASWNRTIGILDGSVEVSHLAFPFIAGHILQYLSLGPLMLVRGILAVLAEIYGLVLVSRLHVGKLTDTVEIAENELLRQEERIVEKLVEFEEEPELLDV